MRVNFATAALVKHWGRLDVERLPQAEHERRASEMVKFRDLTTRETLVLEASACAAGYALKGARSRGLQALN